MDGEVGGEVMQNRICVEDVSKSFYTDTCELCVLEHLNLCLKKGEILAILGPSGSGKSTLLNILSGLLTPTEGCVKIRGTLGYMFQRDHLLEWRNIMDNVTIGLEIRHQLNSDTRLYVEQLLMNYGLWDFRFRFPKELSGGMRQRAALIRTLAMKPDILLLDEPFSALDYQTRLMVSDDVYKILKQEHKEAILVSHDISEVIAMADRVCVLSKRPATLKSTHEILLTVEGERTPFTSRQAPEFKTYFNTLWKELMEDESA